MFRLLPRLVNFAKSRSPRAKPNLNPKRKCSTEVEKWYYRKEKPEEDVPRINKALAEFVMGMFWYNLMWHFYYDLDKMVGHRPPNHELWTDEELGIPPDEEESPMMIRQI